MSAISGAEGSKVMVSAANCSACPGADSAEMMVSSPADSVERSKEW